MKRRILSVISLVLLLTSMLVVPASATDENSTISPRYVNISVFYASVGVNGSGKASCYGDVTTANSTHKVYLDITLQRYKDGYWSNVKSWDTSGTGGATLDKSWYVTSGYYYRTAATATVYTSGGSYVEGVTIYSQSDYY